jgi:ABC-type glycerol-3-phosphate transport system substrate-binding protein
MQKYLLVIVVVLLSVAPLSAAADVVPLDFWFAGADVQMAFMKAAVDEFNAQSTTAQVKLIERPNSSEAMATAIAGGQGPDVLAYNQNTVWFFGLDALSDLKEFVLDPEIGMPAEDFAPAPRVSVNYGGAVIALPYSFGLGAVKYNKKLLDKAGLDPLNPPQTWAEFEAWATALTIKEGDTVAQWGVSCDTVDWLLQEVMLNNGGDWNADDMSEYAPYTEELIGGIEWIDRLVNELKVMPIPRGVTWSGASQMQATSEDFANEQVAMQIGYHSWSSYLGSNPDLQVGIFPIPRGPLAGDTVRISTGYNGLHVLHNAADPREAYLFCKWFIENKSVEFARISFNFPAYAKDLSAYREDPAYAPMVDHLLKSPVRRFHVFPARLDVRSEEPAMVENVVLGRMTPREAVETFKKHADRVFRENRKELDEFYAIQKEVW